MENREREQLFGSEKGDEKVASELALTGFVAIFGLLIFPLFMFSIPFIILFRIIKRKLIPLFISIVSLIVFVFTITYDYKPFLGMYSLIPYTSNFIERLFDFKGSMSLQSYVLYVSGGVVIGYLINLFVDYYRSKLVISKEEKRDEFKDSILYKKIRKQKNSLNNKVQEQWRKDILKNKTEKLLCGISEDGKPYLMDFKEINQHAFVVATTGGGKTILLLNMVEYALIKDYPFVFIDGKGSHESIAEVDQLCRYYGRDLQIFSDTRDLTYNPIKHGNSTVITDKLQHLVDTESQYYVKVNETIVQTLIQFLDAYGIKRDLWNFADYLDPSRIKKVLNSDVVEVEETSSKDNATYSSFLDEGTENENVSKETTVKRERSERAQMFYERFFSRWEASEEGELYLFENASTVRMAIYSMIDSELGKLFVDNDDGLDLLEVSSQRKGLFISLDGSIYDKYIKQIARFIISDINFLVSYRNNHQMKNDPFLAIYDEFSVYANDKIVDTVNKSRSAGFHCVISTQTLADLDKVDPNLKGQIVGNTNTYMVGQTNNQNEIDEWSGGFGTNKDIDVTTVTERRKGNLKRIDLTGDKGTVRGVDKFKIHPNEIRDIRQGEFVFYRKATTDVIQPEIIYTRNPLIMGVKK